MIQLNENILKVLNETAELYTKYYKSRLTNNNINSSSELSNTLDFEVTTNDKGYYIKFKALDYWKYVEYGRKAGKFPNLKAIERWIQIKPIIPRPYKGKVPTAKELAYIIGRSIARKGIKPKNTLQYTLDEVMKIQSEKLEKAIGNDYNLNVGIILTEELKGKNIKTIIK